MTDPCNKLGSFLKDRRGKLDPEAFGFQLARRRTPGLREEMAQRARVSVMRYTWLEQGRGGAPSAAVLERVARARLLTDAEGDLAACGRRASGAGTVRGRARLRAYGASAGMPNSRRRSVEGMK